MKHFLFFLFFFSFVPSTLFAAKNIKKRNYFLQHPHTVEKFRHKKIDYSCIMYHSSLMPLAVDNKNKRIAFLFNLSQIIIFDFVEKKIIKKIAQNRSKVLSACKKDMDRVFCSDKRVHASFNSDGTLLFITYGCYIEIWDLDKNKCLRKIEFESAFLEQVSFCTESNVFIGVVCEYSSRRREFFMIDGKKNERYVHFADPVAVQGFFCDQSGDCLDVVFADKKGFYLTSYKMEDEYDICEKGSKFFKDDNCIIAISLFTGFLFFHNCVHDNRSNIIRLYSWDASGKKKKAFLKSITWPSYCTKMFKLVLNEKETILIGDNQMFGTFVDDSGMYGDGRYAKSD